MNSIFKSAVAIFLIFITQSAFANEVTFSKGSYQEILEQAKQQNKIIMIDFITDWCKWCIETDRKVYTNKEVSDFANEHQINWKIDAEKGEGPDLAKQYNVKGYPTIIFTDAEGKEIDRIYGYLPAEQFLAKMKDYNSGVNTYGAIKKMLEDNPDDPVANYLMADKINSNGLGEDVKIYLNKTATFDPSNEKGYTDDAKFLLAYLNEDPVALQSLLIEYPQSEKVKEGYINLASYYAEKNDYTKADKFFEDAFAKYGKNDEELKLNYGALLLDRAYKIMKKENSTKAEKKEGLKTLNECLQYVKGTVNEASTYYIMSELYFQMKNLKKANECIDKAIAIYDKKSYREQKEKINKQQAGK